jgi:ribonuclease VapC
VILDTSAVVALLLEEEAAGPLETALTTAEHIAISAGSKLECSLVLQTRLGAAGIMLLEQMLQQLAVEVVPFDDSQLLFAQEAFRRFGRGRHPARLNFGDCFSYALARQRDEPLLFIGNDFRQTDVTAALSA